MKRHIGVDLHTNNFTCCFLHEDGKDDVRTFALQSGGLEKFIAGLTRDDEVAVEATGNVSHFVNAVKSHVARIVVISPGQFEVISKSVKKTDKHDARLIAFHLSKGLLPEARLKSQQHVDVSSLAAGRDQLVRMRTSLINKVHGIFVRNGLKVRKAVLTRKAGFDKEVDGREWNLAESVELKVFREQIDKLNEGIDQLEKVIKEHARTLRGYECITSIKGVGELSGGVLLAQIGDIEDFRNAGKLAAYFGIVPNVSNSNQSNRSGRITKRGNKLARKLLVQCAFSAARWNPYFMGFYQRLKAKKGTGKAIIATARKLLGSIYYALKNGVVYEDLPPVSEIEA